MAVKKTTKSVKAMKPKMMMKEKMAPKKTIKLKKEG
jgi:hypothetical protein